MRSILLVLALGSLATLAPSAARAELPRVDSLPTGHMPAVPNARDMPQSIPATEKAEGIFLAIAPEAQRLSSEYNGYRPVFVSTDEQRAKDFAKMGRAPAAQGVHPTTCFSNAGDAIQVNQRIAPRPRPAPPTPSAQPTPGRPAPVVRAPVTHVAPNAPALPKCKPGDAKCIQATPPQKFPSVHALRTEHFAIGDGGRATLDVVDFWADYESLGARLVAKTTVPLQRVARGPGGMDVYAARDGSDIAFLVRTPAAPEEAGSQSLVVRLPSGGDESSGACGGLQFSLSTEQGDGQLANVLGSIILSGPPSDETEPEAPVEDTDGTKHAPKSFHMRPLVANISVSQTRSEKAPILSVTFGWAGNDQRITF